MHSRQRKSQRAKCDYQTLLYFNISPAWLCWNELCNKLIVFAAHSKATRRNIRFFCGFLNRDKCILRVPTPLRTPIHCHSLYSFSLHFTSLTPIRKAQKTPYAVFSVNSKICNMELWIIDNKMLISFYYSLLLRCMHSVCVWMWKFNQKFITF